MTRPKVLRPWPGRRGTPWCTLIGVFGAMLLIALAARGASMSSTHNGGAFCVELSPYRSVCSVQEACISKDGVQLAFENVHVRCKKFNLLPFAGNCREIFNGVLRHHGTVKYRHAYELLEMYEFHNTGMVVPPYRFTKNIFHYGRSLAHALHVAWNSAIYGVNDKVTHTVMSPKTYTANRWNLALTKLGVSALNLTLIDTPNSADSAVCFDRAILLGSDDGPIFQNRFLPIVSLEDENMSSHIPIVPLDALRFKAVAHHGTNSTLSIPYADGSSESVLVDAPPKLICINARSGANAVRSFNPEDQKRLEALVLDVARTHNMDVRTNTFEDLSFAQQVQAMADVGITVAIHGANVMNAVFAPPLSSLVEIFPRFYSPRFYSAGGNSGLQYSQVTSDDPNVKMCEAKGNIPCQRYLRMRRIHLSEEKWEELSHKMHAAAVYLSTLQKHGRVELKRYGEGFLLPLEVEREIIAEWKHIGVLPQSFERQNLLETNPVRREEDEDWTK